MILCVFSFLLVFVVILFVHISFVPPNGTLTANSLYPCATSVILPDLCPLRGGFSDEYAFCLELEILYLSVELGNYRILLFTLL